MTYPVTHQPQRVRRKEVARASHNRSPSFRLSLIILAVIAGFALGLLVLSIGPKLVSKSKESRWLKQAEIALLQGYLGLFEPA